MDTVAQTAGSAYKRAARAALHAQKCKGCTSAAEEKLTCISFSIAAKTNFPAPMF
jgi:hypothetical protein